MLVLLSGWLGCVNPPNPPMEDSPSESSTGTDTGPLPPNTSVLQFDGAPPTHLLMVSIDTLRRDLVLPFNEETPTEMPFLRSLMAEGVLLNDFQQCSNWTFHSVACTVQGQYGEDFGFIPQLFRAMEHTHPRVSVRSRSAFPRWATKRP